MRQLRVGQRVRVHWLMGDDARRYSGVGVIAAITPHSRQVEVQLTEHAGTYDDPRTGATVEFAPLVHYIVVHLDAWHPHIRVEPLGPPSGRGPAGNPLEGDA